MAARELTAHDRERQQLEAFERWFARCLVDRVGTLWRAKQRGRHEARQTQQSRVEYAYPNKEQSACR